VLLFVYGRMPLLSLPMNLLAVPWVSFISLPAGFAAVLVLPLSATLASWLLQLSGWTLDIYWQAMQWGVALGQSWQWSLGGISWLALLLAMAGLCLLFFAPPGLPLRPAGLLLCLPLLWPRGIGLSSDMAEVTVLDVGQGLSVVVRTASHALVYDSGDRSSDRFDAGRDIVAPALRQQRVGELDMLVLSHADNDHAGGAAGLLQEYPARQLWSGTPELLQLASPFLPCRAGMHWHWDGVSFRILHPDSGTPQDDNSRSCVLMVEAGGQRLLLTGDIEQRSEQQLAMAGIDLRADVLLMPHHGSKTSSSPALLFAVRPSLAIASAGYRNRFHHPSAQVIGRYEAQGIRWLYTAETGAIRLRLSAAGIEHAFALCETPVPWRWARYRQYCRH
jgi:competence protein ComEC